MKIPVHAIVGPPDMRQAWLRDLHVDDAVLSPAACPCCAGRVEIQITLARVMRERRPQRIFVELANEEHLGAFGRALNQWPLNQYVRSALPIRLPEDRLLSPENLNDRERAGVGGH